MSENVYQGWLDYDNYGVDVLKENKDDYSGESIAGIFEEYTSKKVSVHYYITNDKVTHEQALEASVYKDLGGEVEADYVLDAYSSWTILEMNQLAKVGGHDILDELSSYEGKYCTLVISCEDSL